MKILPINFHDYENTMENFHDYENTMENFHYYENTMAIKIL